MKDNVKNVSTEISLEVWKKLKIISIQKDISLPEHVKEVLEKSVNKKSFELEEV